MLQENPWKSLMAMVLTSPRISFPAFWVLHDPRHTSLFPIHMTSDRCVHFFMWRSCKFLWNTLLYVFFILQVSAIIDVDVVPETCRRVRLLKHGSDKPLGFYIRDGTSVRVTAAGLEKVPGIFISRLVPGGLAESTGLLAVNDEVLEVNGIEVHGKTLDQVNSLSENLFVIFV
jgi:hypothetical protein